MAGIELVAQYQPQCSHQALSFTRLQRSEQGWTAPRQARSFACQLIVPSQAEQRLSGSAVVLFLNMRVFILFSAFFNANGFA